MLNDAISSHKNVKTWIKAYACTKDFRGNNQMEAIEATAEKQLATMKYHGEKQRYNFETHVSKHLRAHLDIKKAGGEMRERSKVRQLLQLLQASFLVAAIALVCANDKYLESFDQTASYLRTFIIATIKQKHVTFSVYKVKVKARNVYVLKKMVRSIIRRGLREGKRQKAKIDFTSPMNDLL